MNQLVFHALVLTTSISCVDEFVKASIKFGVLFHILLANLVKSHAEVVANLQFAV